MFFFTSCRIHQGLLPVFSSGSEQTSLVCGWLSAFYLILSINLHSSLEANPLSPKKLLQSTLKKCLNSNTTKGFTEKFSLFLDDASVRDIFLRCFSPQYLRMYFFPFDNRIIMNFILKWSRIGREIESSLLGELQTKQHSRSIIFIKKFIHSEDE